MSALEWALVGFIVGAAAYGLVLWLGAPSRGRRKRHTSSRWDGTHATCSCGYSAASDWDLTRHFAEVNRG